MVYVSPDIHPGLYRYSQEVRQYPELTEEQYASVIADLKQPEGSDAYQNAREKLICSHLGMVLGMATGTIHRYYGLSMEDFVGIGNQALVERFDRFDPDKGVQFASYMKKIIVRCEYASVKSHVTWDRDEDVDVDSIGVEYPFTRCYLVRRVEEALQELAPEELRIIRMLFYTSSEPNYKAVAKTLRRTERGLRVTLERIYKKLRPRLKELCYGKKQMYIESRGDDDEHSTA